MDKSMRKSNKKLAEVKKYVAMTKPKQVQSVSVPQTEAPLAVITKSVGEKVDEAEIKKIEKGDFRVIVKRNKKKGSLMHMLIL